VVVSIYCIMLFCYFFFSSRRRHTRSKRDWSSDVCSSDLTVNFRIFDLNITHNFLVWRKKEYEVVYDLLTEQGEIGFSIDQQIKIKTTSRKSGSVIIKFNRFTPTFSCKGVQAKNGYCKVRLYRKK